MELLTPDEFAAVEARMRTVTRVYEEAKGVAADDEGPMYQRLVEHVACNDLPRIGPTIHALQAHLGVAMGALRVKAATCRTCGGRGRLPHRSTTTKPEEVCPTCAELRQTIAAIESALGDWAKGEIPCTSDSE